MNHHPNILNNLLANLRKRYFLGQFKDYVQAVGSGDTYLRKLESGAILQPNEVNLALLVKAYGKQWGPILTLLTHQISSKAYSIDPQWTAIRDLKEQISFETIPYQAIIQKGSDVERICGPSLKCRPESHFLMSEEALHGLDLECQSRLLHHANISFYSHAEIHTLLPMWLPPCPYSFCIDGVLLFAQHGSLLTVTANSAHVNKWNENFTSIQRYPIALERRIRLIRDLEMQKDDSIGHANPRRALSRSQRESISSPTDTLARTRPKPKTRSEPKVKMTEPEQPDGVPFIDYIPDHDNPERLD